MLRRVILVRTEVWEGSITSIISVKGNSDLKTTLALTSNKKHTSVTIKKAIFWDMTPCGCCKNRSFGGTYRLHNQGENNQQARNNVKYNQQLLSSVLRLIVTANFFLGSLIIFILIMEAIFSSET
jgi:hypothetical protein